MSTPTNIQWTDVVDNIIVVEGGGWWCRMVSPGCAHCYAAKLNQNSWYGGNKLPYKGEPPKLVLRQDILDSWARQTKPKKHFVASMTDVFGEWVPTGFTFRFLTAMAKAPKQTFQVLTKRPDVALKAINYFLTYTGMGCLPQNIWIGVSVEDQQRADERLPILKSIPASVRFVSYEPALERVDFELRVSWVSWLSWMILGGESGPNARPCNVEWIRDGVRQCRAAGVAPFVKQLGSSAVTYESCGDCDPCLGGRPDQCAVGRTTVSCGLRHSKGGEPSEWPEDFRIREFPAP